MNLILSGLTLVYLLATALLILRKHRKIRRIVMNVGLTVASFVGLWVGRSSNAFWTQLGCNLAIGACLLFGVVHSYNQLIAPPQKYNTLGEGHKPRPFGNGYWR